MLCHRVNLQKTTELGGGGLMLVYEEEKYIFA